MMKANLEVAALAVIVVGCGASRPVVLTDVGRSVRLMKADPPTGCTELGPVTGDASGSGARIGERSRVTIRTIAGERGANYVRMETVDRYGIVSGTAFKCPSQPFSG